MGSTFNSCKLLKFVKDWVNRLTWVNTRWHFTRIRSLLWLIFSLTGTFPDHVTNIFKPTAKIPASGFSFAVTMFKSTDSIDPPKDSSKPPVRIWADKYLIRFMIEAKKIAVRAIEFYSEYFEAPLYAPKLDILAEPKLPADDTEKFGLISLEWVNSN